MRPSRCISILHEETPELGETSRTRLESGTRLRSGQRQTEGRTVIVQSQSSIMIGW